MWVSDGASQIQSAPLPGIPNEDGGLGNGFGGDGFGGNGSGGDGSGGDGFGGNGFGGDGFGGDGFGGNGFGGNGFGPLAASINGQADDAARHAPHELTPCQRILSSLGIMLASMGLAMTVDDVSVVWGFIGSTAAILLGFTFPCVAYIRLRQTPSTRATSVRQRKVVAWFITILSLLLIPTCLTVTTVELVNATSSS